MDIDATALDRIRATIPDYARDLKLNLGSVLSTTGAPGLREQQIWALALSSAIAARNQTFTRALEAVAAQHLDAAHILAARAAAAIMGMNNIYYRFLHLVEDSEYQTLPARLRMNVLANPGIDQLDFELLSLAVSAINGCGLCVSSHERKLRQHGISREMIQSAVRIAATVHAVAVALEYSEALNAPPAHGPGADVSGRGPI
jgi:alkyl hydroperoxide reductase subunit D